MKTILHFFLILLYLNTSCLVENKKAKDFQPKEPREIKLTLNGKKLYVNDSANYSQKFINGLRSAFPNYDSLILIKDSLFVYYAMTSNGKILHNVQPTKLPTELPQAKEIIYRAEQNGKSYLLKLVRINLTEINFDFMTNNKTSKKGNVILDNTFFLGDESVEDNGNVYFLSQYSSDNPQSSQASSVIIKVQIGSGERVLYEEHFPDDMMKDLKVVLKKQ